MECDCGWAGALAAVPNVTAACTDYDGIDGAGNDVVGRLGCQNEEKKGEENVATSREAVTNVGGEFRIFVWDVLGGRRGREVELCHIHATSCIGCRFALLEMVVSIALVVFLLPSLCHSQQVHSGKNATLDIQIAEY